MHFKDKLSLASGFCFMGSGFGQLIMPNLLHYFLKVLDARGAMLLMAGCTLQILVGMALFRPGSYYTRPVHPPGRTPGSDNYQAGTIGNKRHSGLPDSGVTGSFTYMNNDDTGVAPAVGHHINETYIHNDELETVDLTCPQHVSNGLCTSSPEVDGKPKPRNSGEHRELVLSAAQLTHVKHQSTHNSSTELRTAEEERPQEDTINQNKPQSFMADMRQLRSSSTIPLFLLAKTIILQSYTIPILFLPAYASSEGMNMDEVTLFMTVVGGVDMISRPLHGWIASFPSIDAATYCGSLVILASLINGKYQFIIFELNIIFFFK